MTTMSGMAAAEATMCVPNVDVPEVDTAAGDTAAAGDTDAALYCVCREPWGNRFMIACDGCEEWFHGQCVGIEEAQEPDIERYHCPECARTRGPTQFKLKRKSHRARTHIDYAALDAGQGRERHPHEDVLAQRSFARHDFPRMSGSQMTVDYVAARGLDTPVLFESSEGLDMRMPSSDTAVEDIARMLGDRPLEVMDCKTQQTVAGWTLFQWAHYFSHPEERKTLMNVISLEVSDTPLGNLIERPRIVRELDWVDRFWPKALAQREFPKVQVYCLMSPASSWTDFHIDFGGTSVYYHLLSGGKTFYMIPPHAQNLKKYEEWCKSHRQNHVFFGDEVKMCYQVDLDPGQTMLIPSGWIHAVYTRKDSVVIGGNFLHGFGAGIQASVYRLESRCGTPAVFRFPFFEKLNWYAAMGYERLLKATPSSISDRELVNVESLVNFLNEQIITLTTKHHKETVQSPKTAERKVIKESIPEELASTYRQFIVDLSRMVASERGARLRVLISGISSKTATAGTKRKADEGVDSDDLVDDGGAQNGTTLA